MSELQVVNILNYYLEDAGSSFKTFEVFNFELNENSEGVWNTDFSQVLLVTTDEEHKHYIQENIKFNKDIKYLSLLDLRNAVKDLCA